MRQKMIGICGRIIIIIMAACVVAQMNVPMWCGG